MPGLTPQLLNIDRCIMDDLVSFNTFWEKRNYDNLECLALLKKESVLPESTELVKKIVATDAVFSPQGRANLLEGLDSTNCSEFDFWIYTCEPYSILLGRLRDDYFILDTHPVPDFMGGNGNGLLTVSSESGCESKQDLF